MRNTLKIVMLLGVMAWLVGGCSSESTAPNDDLPQLTEGDVATQSGFMAMAVVQISPVAFCCEPDGKADASDGNYLFSFTPGDAVQGDVLLHFRVGGENGTPSGYDVADWGRAWTADEAPLTIEVVDGGALLEADFVLTSTLDRDAGTAVTNGSGTLTLVDYVADWTLEAITLEEDGDYPTSGTLTFTNEGITGTVTFDGDNTASLTVGEMTWSVELNDGSLTER